MIWCQAHLKQKDDDKKQDDNKQNETWNDFPAPAFFFCTHHLQVPTTAWQVKLECVCRLLAALLEEKLAAARAEREAKMVVALSCLEQLAGLLLARFVALCATEHLTCVSLQHLGPISKPKHGWCWAFSRSHFCWQCSYLSGKVNGTT